MASSCPRIFIRRSSLSSIKSAFRSNGSKSAAATSNPFPLPAKSSPLRRFSLSRSPSELGSVQSMLPLHSVVAASRMTSCLSTTSKSCRALSQEFGLSVPR